MQPGEKNHLAEDLIKALKNELSFVTEKNKTKIQAMLQQDGLEPNLWQTANLLGEEMNRPGLIPPQPESANHWITKIRNFQGKKARISDEPTTVVFGTSGWRGIIGEDFNVLNVHKVVASIVQLMKSSEYLNKNGFDNFEKLKKAGVFLLRDNRFLGDEFIIAACKELAAEGIQIYNANECPTGVGSALVVQFGAAGSINFTPSHNPMEYAGLKFNPADGGPADKEFTGIIEEISNEKMQNGKSFTPSEIDYGDYVNEIDAPLYFRKFVENNSRIFDLQRIRKWLRKNKNDIRLIVDNMHGSSRGYIERLLGEEIVAELKEFEAIQFLNTNDDPSFHGLKPEPNAKNQVVLMKVLQQSPRRWNLAVALDPDADRIRFADHKIDIDMNRFGPIAYGHFLARELTGGLASTVASSSFGAAIAEAEGMEYFETPVGFKNFRPVLNQQKVLLAFEESDGITVRHHTLEKCALAGLLCALDSLCYTEKNLSEQYETLQSKYGCFYPGRAGLEVTGVKVAAWEKYKINVVNILNNDVVREGDSITIGDETKTISRVDARDGVKLFCEGGGWILLRPSGTEPKFRLYYEVQSTSPLNNPQQELVKYQKAAEGILQLALQKAGKPE